MNTHTIKIKDHKFVLSTNLAVYWSNKNTLIFSDSHIGKPLTDLSPERIVEQLNKLIKHFKPQRIIIVGDLFDARSKVDWTPLKEFFESLNIEIILVLGNHDVFPAKKYLGLGINLITNQLNEDMFMFTHKPTVTDKLNIHGHLHPSINKYKSKKGVKVPCFYLNTHYFCLPAFGGLIRDDLIESSKDNTVYAAAEKFKVLN